MDKKKLGISLLMMVLAAALLIWHERHEGASAEQAQYYHNQGTIFGTTYSIQYEGTEDLHDQILARLQAFDGSLSMFNEHSVISLINRNEDTLTDLDFEQMYATAHEVSELSHGAFDITVAPLVNLWGFGFKNKEQVTAEHIDSLLQIVGYESITLQDHHLLKQHPETMLDASAVAKGQACDIVAQLIAEKGCRNYLVEIGGEVVARGMSPKHKPWRIGINKPVEDSTGMNAEIEDIIQTDSICMATSGNYRNFYYEGGEKRSHTIDPRTGHPVAHTLLSATVVSGSCMRADALATACMVLGEEEAIRLIERARAKCYLIVADGEGTRIRISGNWDLTEIK